MRFMFFTVASLALLAVCLCAPAAQDVIQKIPKEEPTPSATGKDGAKSGAAVGGAAASDSKPRARRDLGGQESDLLPSSNDVEGSPFADSNQLEGRTRIKVLPAYLG